jgi:hypothetical protein
MLCQGFYTKNQSKLLASALSESTYIWLCLVQALILVMASSSGFTYMKITEMKKIIWICRYFSGQNFQAG